MALVAASAPGAAHAALYRWVDAQGQVHFSDQPHAGAQAFDPHVVPAAPASAPAAAAHAPAKAASECANLEAQLDRYRKASSITETDALGNSHTLTSAERDRLLSGTQARVHQTCSRTGDGNSSAPAAD